MVPSSRTPEGSPNHCPVCGNPLLIEPSQPPGDAPCPTCGHLLWFLREGVSPSEPGPAADVRLTPDQLDWFLRRLDPAHRPILELRLQGYTSKEIADEVGVSERTVFRVLDLVRQVIRRGTGPTGPA